MSSFNWKETYGSKIVTASEAVSHIKSGNKIFIGTGCAEPQALVDALTSSAHSVDDASIFHLLTMGLAPYAHDKFTGRYRFNSFFISQNVRDAVQEGLGDYTPIFLSEIPRQFELGRIPLDVALIQTTLPNAEGMVSLGISVDIVKSAAENARLVIAEVNPNMPWTHGNSQIPVDFIDYLVESDKPLLPYSPVEINESVRAIGRNIASLIEDGSTIEIGIGAIPQSILEFLKDKKNLGIHTEMFTDSLIDLIESGVINGSKKTINPGKVVASFMMGSDRLYKYANNNPKIEMHPSEFVNDPFVIGQQPKMVAINVALEVDLTGQVCADSLGHKFYSGIGGQVDFIRGAARSSGGKPIIAMKSTAKEGKISRIVASLSDGAGVVTTRGDVHYVITEYGIANLHGKCIRDRAMALINIAHPKFRNELLKQAKKLNYVYEDQVELNLEAIKYPAELERCTVIADGTEILLRPIRPTDEEPLRDMFYSSSEESKHFRFFTVPKSLPHDRVMPLVNIDYEKDMALVATSEEVSGEKIVAVGRYMRSKKGDKTAEVAFLVRDDWQNRGMGRALLASLIEIAIEKGIEGFVASVLQSNKSMLNVFHNCGYKLKMSLEDGIYELAFNFNEPN